MTTRKQPKYANSEREAELKVKKLVPLNENQALYLDALKTSNQTIVCGYSGTGKTYLAATYAANMYALRQVNKIVITRPNIPVGKDPGALPGDLREKFAPWAAPIMDVITAQLGTNVVESALKNNNIELAPLTYMRGRSFENAFIILDEAQNTTIAEMKMFLTRVGNGCKVVINGDIKQSDLRGIYNESGLAKIIHLVKTDKLPVPIIEFGVNDIVRSEECKMWIMAFERARL